MQRRAPRLRHRVSSRGRGFKGLLATALDLCVPEAPWVVQESIWAHQTFSSYSWTLPSRREEVHHAVV